MLRSFTRWGRRKGLIWVLLSFLPILGGEALGAQKGGKIVFVLGAAYLGRSPEGPWVEATANSSIQEGEFLLVRERGRVGVIFPDHSQVQVRGPALIQVIQLAARKPVPKRVSLFSRVSRVLGGLYRLFGGRLWIRAPHPVDWDVGVGSVGVRGTDLVLSLDPRTQEVSVAVLSGEVHLSSPLGMVVLGPMERAFMSATTPPRKEALLIRQARTVQWILRCPVWVSPRDINLVGKTHWPLDLHAALKARDSGDLDLAMALIPPREDPMAQILGGWVLMERGEQKRAQGMIGPLVWAHPLAASGTMISLIKEGLYREAQEIGEEALGIWPQEELLHALCGAAALGAGSLERAAELLGRSSFPKEPLLLVQRGLLSFVEGDLEGAKEISNTLEREGPPGPSSHLLKAILLRAEGDLEAARSEAKKAISADPGFLPGLIQGAELAWAMEDVEEAMALLQSAREIDPMGHQARLLQGFMELAAGRTGSAMAAFQEVLEKDPLSSEAHMGLGIANMRLGNLEGALEELLSASLAEPMASLPLSYLGKVLHSLGRSEDALSVLTRASELDPRDPTPYLYKGLILRDLNRPSEAIKSIEASMARNRGRCVYRSRFLLDGDSAVRNANLAEAYRDMGLLQRAKNHAILSVREDPTNSSAHLFLSTPFWEGGSTRAGLRELLRAQMLSPVNINLFNTFHDYTVMFEGAQVRGELEGGGGEMGLRGSSLFLQGATAEAAASGLFSFQEDEGFHEENHSQRDKILRFDGKVSVSRGHEILGRYSIYQWAQGDHRGDTDSEWVQDPYLHQKGHIATAVVGYRWRLGPREEFLAYGVLSRQGFGLEDKTFLAISPSLGAVMDLDWMFRERHVQFGVLRMGRAGEHRWELGIHGARGDAGLDSSTRVRWRGLEGGVFNSEANRLQNWAAEIHAGDIWRIGPSLFLEASIHLQAMRFGQMPPVFSSMAMEKRELSPRVGLVWEASGEDIVRVGLARYLEPPYTVMEGLQPVEVAGFPLGEDSKEASLNHEAHLEWYRRWPRGISSFVHGRLRKHRSWEAHLEGVDFQAVNLQEVDLGVGLEAILLPTLALCLSYDVSFLEREKVDEPRGVFPGEAWREHRWVGELRWVHPSGWRAALRQTFALQMGDLGPLGKRQDAFWTDLEVEKFLWGRRLSLRFTGRNLWDTPFRLKTRELVAEKGIPARQLAVWLRWNF